MGHWIGDKTLEVGSPHYWADQWSPMFIPRPHCSGMGMRLTHSHTPIVSHDGCRMHRGSGSSNWQEQWEACSMGWHHGMHSWAEQQPKWCHGAYSLPPLSIPLLPTSQSSSPNPPSPFSRFFPSSLLPPLPHTLHFSPTPRKLILVQSFLSSSQPHGTFCLAM